MGMPDATHYLYELRKVHLLHPSGHYEFSIGFEHLTQNSWQFGFPYWNTYAHKKKIQMGSIVNMSDVTNVHLYIS